MRELPEPTEVIAEGEQFSMISCGNGSLYALRSKEDKTSAYIEGGDIPTFLAEYENAKTAYPAYNADQILSQIWDQGGYSWMAVPDEE